MPYLKNRDINRATEALGGRRHPFTNAIIMRGVLEVSFSDILLVTQYAQIAQAIEERANFVSPIERKLGLDFAKLKDGKPVPMIDTDSGEPIPNSFQIDPSMFTEWEELHNNLLDQEFEVPHMIKMEDLLKGKWRDDKGKVHPYVPEGAIIVGLGPILDINNKQSSKSDGDTD